MIKYVCDMCGKPLLEMEDVRYVVKIEVYPAYGEETPEDYDELDSMEDALDAAEDSEPLQDEDSYFTFRFDLCPTCHKRYLDDPLFKNTYRRIRFSDN